MSQAPDGSGWVRDAWAYEARRRLRRIRRGLPAYETVGPAPSAPADEDTRTMPVWEGWVES